MEQNPNTERTLAPDTEENRQAYEQYVANYKPQSYTVTYGDQSYTYSSDEIDRIKTAYRYMNADEAYSKKAYESYTNSDFDQFAMQNGLPSWKLWSDVEKYASGGGLKDNYGGVSSDQWKKINELWAKDWEYGLTDADAYRKANGLAPVSYDSMYGDTLLDAELKAAGLPPSKLLNGELGDKYRAWSNDSAKWTEFMDAVDRRYIEKTTTIDSADNPLATLGNVGKAATYTLDDALNETLADPQWAEFANAHFGVRADVPEQYSDAYIMTEKDEFGNKYEVRDENGNLVYDTAAWDKDRQKATKNNLAIDADEFAITSDRVHDYYDENGQQTMALMAAEKAFAAQGKTLNANTAQEFSNLWSDYYAGFSLNDGEGYTIDLLFPDANLSEEERAELQPFIDKANRIRIEQGYEASREYLVGGEFSRELKQMNDDKIVAYYRNLGNSAGEGSKYYGKSDKELLNIYYEEQGEKYGMTPDEIAQMERGELSIDDYMHAKCTDVASAEQLADDMYVAYCKREKLPLTREELDNAMKRSYFNVESFINSIGSPIETANYREQEEGERRYGVQDLLRMGDDEFDKHYVDERSYLESLPWKDYEQRDKILSDLTKEEEYVRGLRNHIRDITPEYYNESVEKPDYNLGDLDRRLAIANQKKLEFTIDAIAYTPEFAEKTADMDYVNQRFDQIIDKYAKSSADLSDVVIYATDDDKRKLVYLVDNNGETKAEKTTYDAVGESVVPRTVYVDALATDPDTYLNKILLHKWDNMAREDKRANTEMIDGGVIATIGSIIANPFESVYNFFADVGELIQGNEILSSQRATWSTDVQSRIAENISETWAGDVGAFLYQLIPSTVQSGASMWLAAHTGGLSEAFTLTLMSTESYSSAVDQALQNGASSGEAFLIGLANGANEALFEHLSLESFLKQGNINTVVGEILASGKDLTNATVRKTFAKELGKRMLFHGLVEGSEELNTSLANLFAESLILGVNSSYNKSVERYVQAGLSREEAEERATGEVFKSVAMDFVGGLVSGAFMTVGNDLVESRGGRVFIDRTGMTNFVSQTHNLSLVKTEDALDYAKKNLEKDANGLVTVDSAQRVFDDLRKQGADAATLSRVRDSFSTAEQITANQGAQAVAQTAIREQRNEDGKKLVKAASQMIYNKAQNGKGTVKVSEAEIARVTNEYLDRLTGTVQAGDIRNIELASEAMRLGYIDDIKGLAGYDTIAGGMNSIAEYYNTLSAEDQTAIKENAKKYINTYNHAGITGAQAGRYANAAAILEYAVSNTDALNGLNSVFGSAASVSPQAVANACLNEDAKASMAYVDACCRALSVLLSQNGSHLFSAAQNNTNATAYVASQMALAASMPTDTSYARAMYDYVSKYGATPETMDLLTAANICESIGTEQTDIRRANGRLYTTEQIAQITREYNKALTNYNNKKAIAQAHEQADATERTEHEARIEKYRTQIEELYTMMENADSDTLEALIGKLANATSEFQNAQSAIETLIANQNQRDTQTKADLASAESAYNDAKEKYQNAMQEHAANYTQRMGDILESINGKQKVSLAALRQANALVMYGTEENLNDIQQKIIAAEKTAAVAIGNALGADVQCVKFDEAFLKERKIPKSKWEEAKTKRGMRQGGTIYLNESVMKPEVGSLTNEVLLHEIGHFLEESPDNYNAYKEFAIKYMRGQNSDAANAFIAENGEDELVAEFTRQVSLADPRAVAALCKSAPKMSMRVFQWLTNTNNRMSSVAVSQSKIVRDAQRAFASGIKAVRSENANQTETSAEDATRGSAMRDAEKVLNDVVQYEQKMPTNKVDNSSKKEYNNIQGEKQNGTEQSDARDNEAESERDVQGLSRSDVEVGDRVLSETGDDGRADLGRTEQSSVNTYPVEAKDALSAKGIVLFDMANTDNSQSFYDLIGEAKQNNPYGAFVTQHEVGEYDGMKLYLDDSGNVGVAVTSDGNIVSVFKNPNGGAKGAVSSILLTALQNGGVKLDNFNSHTLSAKYAQHGFIPVSRTAFVDEFAPDDWNYERDGRPDIVFWVHNGDSLQTVAEKTGSYPDPDIDSVPMFDDYEQAEEYRDNLLNENKQKSSTVTLPFELPEKAQSLIDNFVESKASHAIDGKVSPDTNETIRNLVKNQVAKAATAVGVTLDAETIDAYAEQYTLPEFETSGESWVNNYKPTETKTRVSTDFADIINSTAMSDAQFYTEIDPEAYAVQNTIDKMTADEKRMNGDPRLIQTNHGFVVARKVSREGLVTGNPVFNKGETPVAMIAPVSEFPNGDVGKLVPLSKCTALVVPNTHAYAETRTDAREMGVNVYPYNSEDPTAFDRAINRAAQQSNVQFFPNETYDDFLERYGAKKPGAQPRVENRPVPERTSDTNRVSDMARNAAEAPVTTDDTYKNGIRNWITNGTATHEPISNAKTLEKARGTIERAGSINQAAADLHRDVANSNGKATDLLARAELLYVEAQNPASGLTELEREEIFGDMCIIASDAGRALQAASLLKNMTAEGHIHYIEQVGKRMSDRYQKRTKERVNLKLTEEEKERYRTAVTEEQRKEIDDEVGKRFAEETSKLTFLDKIRNWRYFSMLGNPRTHFRNIVGNSLMRPVARVKDAINAGLQAAFGVEQADRTTTAWTGRVDAATRAYVEEQLKAALPIMQGVSSKYADEVAKSPTESNDGSLKATLTQEVPTARLSNGKTRIGRFLNTLSFINSNALELEDARALGHRFRSSMYQIIKARGLDVNNISDEQRDSIVNYAMEESLRATFRDANALADAINKFARTKRATQFLTEAIIPFKKTPLNIAKRSIEYSPIGLVNGIYKLCSNTPAYNAEIKRIDAMQNVSDAEKAQMKQDAANTAKMQKIAAIDRLSQGLTGSLLTAIGLFASKMGWISIGRKDDEEAAFEQGLGKNTYSLNIGDLSIDLSAFAPSAVPMLMGSALYEAFGADRGDGGAFVSDLISVLCESVDPVTEMSMLSGLADAFQGLSYSGNEDGGKTRYIGTVIGNAMSSYVGQFIPTFVGQIARVTDPYARSYSAGDDYWASSVFGSEVGSVVKSMQNKIPFLSWLSEPKVDVHGNPVKNYTNWGSYIFHPLNNFILPATIKQDSKNEIDDELVRLYGVVDSADIFPTKPSRNLGAYTDKKTGQKYQFKITNDSEYTQYQMDVGQTVYDMLEDLMQSRAYARMTDEQKAEAIAKVIDQAQSSVKKRWKAQKIAAIGK